MVQVMVCTHIEAHPNKEFLKCYNFKNKDEIIQVVDHSNYNVGDKVAIARIGTLLPPEYGSGENLVEIIEQKIGDSISQGLILGPTNAGIGDDISIAYGAI